MIKYIFSLVTIAILGLNTLSSQTFQNGDLLLIREDVVKPSMAETYELALLDLAAFFIEQNEPNINYITHVQDDFHYTHITSINELNNFQAESIGKYSNGDLISDEFDFIWGVMNETMISHRTYVVEYDETNSYVPDGSAWLEGMPYRKWNYYYFTPGSENEADGLLAAWKGLYEKHNIQNGYRVYRGVLGIDQPVIIFTSWGKNPVDYYKGIDANMELLGEEGSVLLLGMLEISIKIETIEGYYVPEFSYQPE